jgi:CrcB protein
MVKKFIRRFYDSHPNLPLDPDSDQLHVVRPIHTDPAHIMVVAFGAFFGTLARYEIGLLLPSSKDGWPVATFFVNVAGAFLLGWLLQMLLYRGKDEGVRRIARLLFGTGFLGSFTTYSSLASGAVLLMRDGSTLLAVGYALLSVLFGMVACAAGIWLATMRYERRVGGNV